MGRRHEKIKFEFTSKGTVDAGRFERVCRAACDTFVKDCLLAQTWTDPELRAEADAKAEADFKAALQEYVHLPEIESAVSFLKQGLCKVQDEGKP